MSKSHPFRHQYPKLLWSWSGIVLVTTALKLNANKVSHGRTECRSGSPAGALHGNAHSSAQEHAQEPNTLILLLVACLAYLLPFVRLFPVCVLPLDVRHSLVGGGAALHLTLTSLLL